MRKKILSVLLALSLTVGGTVYAPANSEAAEEATYKYVTMNVPYTDFYAAYDLLDKAVWQVEDGVDAVSTATTTKFMSTGIARGTYNDGTYIIGVTLPVALDEEEYAELSALKSELTEKDSYYFTDLESVPEVYSEISIEEDGSYSFSKLQDATLSIDNDYVYIDNYTMVGGYGDYQVDLVGFSTDGTLQISADEYVPYTIYGAILYTEESGESGYGMTALENLWYGTRVEDVQIAWSVIGGQGLRRAHGSGDEYYQFDMNGATLTSIDVITDLGIINIACDNGGLKLDEYYTGDLSALTYAITNDSKELTINGVPTDLEDVTVTLSGGNSNLAQRAQITGDKVALSDYPVDGITYTLTISSSNYPDITKTLSTPISEAQKAELQKWMDKARAVEAYESDSDLQEHAEEAEELIANTDATSAEAAELIGELMEKVKKYYPTATATATLKGSVLSIALDVSFETLENPEYALSYRAGRNSIELTSGDLTALTQVLGTVPTVDTEYTLTITSDNYQDITATVKAEKEEEVETTTEKPAETTKKEETTTKAPVETTTAAATAENTTSNAKKPAKVTGVKVKKNGKKKIKVTWKKANNVNGYQIQYATNKKFKKAKSVTVKKASKTKKVIKKLKSKKTYYVRVRAYTTNAGKKSYGAWSAKKSVKVK